LSPHSGGFAEEKKREIISPCLKQLILVEKKRLPASGGDKGDQGLAEF
jgi:hypothetical protein